MDSFYDKLSLNHNIRLNRQQLKAATHDRGPALVIAGPGSGKTTVIMARLAYLIFDRGVEPGKILTMTFGKSAAMEMSSRFKRIFGAELSGKVRFSTLHSYCYSIVMKNYARSGSTVKLLTDSGSIGKYAILAKIFADISGRKAGEDEIKKLESEIGYVKNRMISDLLSYKGESENFYAIFTMYEKYKSENKLVDYDDLLTIALGILKSEVAVTGAAAGGLDYFQIDEGQDLSKVQSEIIRVISAPYGNVFMVADDDQSIYSFRGAEPENLLKFGVDFPGAVFYYLEENYRSTANIVKTSGGFISINIKRYAKNYFTNNGAFADPCVIKVADFPEQTRIIKEIAGRAAAGSVAVLFRNNISAIPAADLFNRSGMDFNLDDSNAGFFSHWAVGDILHILKTSVSDFSEEELLKIREIIDFKNEKRTSETERVLRRIGRSKPADALELIRTNTDYFARCRYLCGKYGYSLTFAARAAAIMRYISESCLKINDFLARMENLKEVLYNKTQNKCAAGIKLSTIHSAKGLEYDCVILIDLYDGEFPGKQSIEQYLLHGDGHLLEEERRLFYVGMTRAKKRLYIICPGGESAFADALIKKTGETLNA